jgi:hypothetical protein
VPAGTAETARRRAPQKTPSRSTRRLRAGKRTREGGDHASHSDCNASGRRLLSFIARNCRFFAPLRITTMKSGAGVAQAGAVAVRFCVDLSHPRYAKVQGGFGPGCSNAMPGQDGMTRSSSNCQRVHTSRQRKHYRRHEVLNAPVLRVILPRLYGYSSAERTWCRTSSSQPLWS